MIVDLVMRSVLASGRASGRSGRALDAALCGLWLGLLSDAQLQALDERYYDRAAMYQSVAWNESGLSDWERDAVRRWFAPGSRIVVPACGGGREVLALLQDGYDAIGYESHPALWRFGARLLAQRGYPGRVLRAARDAFPHHSSCGGVLIGWGAYSLIAPHRLRVAFLAAAAAAASPGGHVILSCFELRTASRHLDAIAAGANLLRRLRRAAPVESGDVLAPNRVHVFAREQLAAEMRQAGLDVEEMRAAGTSGHTAVGYLCAVGRAR